MKRQWKVRAKLDFETPEGLKHILEEHIYERNDFDRFYGHVPMDQIGLNASIGRIFEDDHYIIRTVSTYVCGCGDERADDQIWFGFSVFNIHTGITKFFNYEGVYSKSDGYEYKDLYEVQIPPGLDLDDARSVNEFYRTVTAKPSEQPSEKPKNWPWPGL